MVCMGDSERVVCEWSWEENKLFELALAKVDENDHPDRWKAVAANVGGHKTAHDVHQHFMTLLQDLHFIESGHLDHKLEEERAVPGLTKITGITCRFQLFKHSTCIFTFTIYKCVNSLFFVEISLRTVSGLISDKMEMAMKARILCSL